MSTTLTASSSIGNAGLVNILSNIGAINLNISPSTGTFYTNDSVYLANVNGGERYNSPYIFGATFQPTYGYGIGSRNSGLNSGMVNANFGSVKQIVCSFEDYSQIETGTQIYNPYALILNTGGYISIWSSGNGYPSSDLSAYQLAYLSNARQIEQSDNAIFVVFNDGRLTGFGTSPYLFPNKQYWTNVTGGHFAENVAKVSTSDRHGILLFNDKTFTTWGANDQRQTRRLGTVSMKTVP